MARILLVLPVHGYRSSAFLRAAERLGVEAVVASEEASSLAAFMDGRHLVLDLRSPAEAAGAAEAFARRHPVDGVVGADESAVLTAAHVAHRLGLRQHPVDAVATTRDKVLARERLSAAGVAQPRWERAASVEEAVAAAGRVGYPVVAKPRTLAASRGVIRANDEGALRAAATVALRLEATDGCGEPGILVEEFVPGAEVVVEGLVRGGDLEVVAVFDKPDPLDGPTFEETLMVTPSRLPEARWTEVVATARSAVEAIGLSDGPVHAEQRVGAGGTTVLEVAARSIGGLCSGALRFEGGSTLEELIIGDALGRPRGPARPVAGAAGVMMLPMPGPGRLGDVVGLEAARAVPGVEDVVVTVPRGGRLVPLPEGDRYLGFAFARGGSPAEVEAALRAAHAALRVEVLAEE